MARPFLNFLECSLIHSWFILKWVVYKLLSECKLLRNKTKISVVILCLNIIVDQSLFKTSHVTRRPSLKRLSGIQVQLLSLPLYGETLNSPKLFIKLMIKYLKTPMKLDNNCVINVVFFCSNSVIKSVFLRPDHAQSWARFSVCWLFL